MEEQTTGQQAGEMAPGGAVGAAGTGTQAPPAQPRAPETRGAGAPLEGQPPVDTQPAEGAPAGDRVPGPSRPEGADLELRRRQLERQEAELRYRERWQDLQQNIAEVAHQQDPRALAELRAEQIALEREITRATMAGIAEELGLEISELDTEAPSREAFMANAYQKALEKERQARQAAEERATALEGDVQKTVKAMVANALAEQGLTLDPGEGGAGSGPVDWLRASDEAFRKKVREVQNRR